jgi:DNA-binding MarR family transcriptional regulator
MVEPGQLSVNDRVLLHLSRFATDMPPEEYPSDSTQAGIAHAVGISRTHVPRAVKALMKEGFAEELTTRVKGHERRMSVYAITPEGLRRSEAIWKEVLAAPFSVMREGAATNMTGAQIEALMGRKKAVAAISQMRDGVVEMEGKRRSPIRVMDEAPDVREFYDRDAELKAMEQFMESAAKALVVLGNRGYGTSALCRKFLDDQEESDVLWISMGGSPDVKSIQQALVDFGKGFSKEAASLRGVLGLADAIIVFDDYFEVSEEVVEFLSGLMENEGEAKLIITARQETPAYNWFYRKEQVDSGRVRELRVKGLDEVSAMKLLGNPNLEKDALKRIMMLTRGQPLVLRLLRDGDQSGLRKNTVFTAEEIGYLVFLKDKTA